MATGSDRITHPNAQLHIFTTVHLHPFIQQTNFFKVKPVHYKAPNQCRTPGGINIKIRTGLLPEHSCNKDLR